MKLPKSWKGLPLLVIPFTDLKTARKWKNYIYKEHNLRGKVIKVEELKKLTEAQKKILVVIINSRLKMGREFLELFPTDVKTKKDIKHLEEIKSILVKKQ